MFQGKKEREQKKQELKFVVNLTESSQTSAAFWSSQKTTKYCNTQVFR